MLFDLFAIAVGLKFWHKLIVAMFDTTAWYWNLLWGGFIALGGAVFALGISLLIKRKTTKNIYHKSKGTDVK